MRRSKACECNTLGSHLFRCGNVRLAIVEFRRAVKLRPLCAAYWQNLGAALIEAREYDEAARCLRKALQLSPDHAGALFHLGQMAEIRGDLPAAHEYFTRVVEAAPYSEFARRAKDSLSGPPKITLRYH